MSDPFDFFDPAFARNPYPFYDWLRTHDPIHHGIGTDVGITSAWHVVNHAEVMQVLRDNRFAHRERPDASALPPEMQLFLQLAGQSLLFNNPPAHTRLRKLVSKAFTPRAVEQLRPQISATATDLLDQIQQRRSGDIIADYALPLTMTIIASMLGFPDTDRPKVAQWGRILVDAIDCKQSNEPFARGGMVAMEIYGYFMAVLARLRAQPDDSILSGLIQAHDADDRLSETEIIVTATTLLIAGHETTVNLIGNAVHALLQHPEQYVYLQRNPQIVTTALEEVLRFESPSQMVSRIATEPLMVGQQPIESGELVNLLLGGANRDPQIFADPDTLDITRSTNPHCAFSNGIHFCLGAPLARLESTLALGMLAERFPRMVIEEAVWRPTIGFRGLSSLHVTIA